MSRLDSRLNLGFDTLQAVAAYAVIVVFGAAYGIVTVVWGGLSRAATAAVALLVAAPLALGLLWPRLTGLKAFGIEISLAQASASSLSPELADKVMAAVSSSEVQVMAEQVAAAAAPAVVGSSPELPGATGAELIEINLRDGAYWWASRLYLLAALADDFLSVDRLVFTEQFPNRVFVGMASPSAITTAIGAALPPEVEQAYLSARQASRDMATAQRVSSVAFAFVLNLEQAQPREMGTSVREADLPRVSKERLHEWLAAAGKQLYKDSAVLGGQPREETVRQVAAGARDRYVAIIRPDRELLQVVDRISVLSQIAGTTPRA